MKTYLFKTLVAFITFGFLFSCQQSKPDNASDATAEIVQWKHLSSLQRDLPFAGVGNQVSTLIFDIDRDGTNDFVIAGWGKPAMHGLV